MSPLTLDEIRHAAGRLADHAMRTPVHRLPFGADVVFAENTHAGFELATRLAEQEGTTLIHPFEGRTTALGTATLGLELCEQIAGLQVIVPIGGGNLCEPDRRLTDPRNCDFRNDDYQ